MIDVSNLVPLPVFFLFILLCVCFPSLAGRKTEGGYCVGGATVRSDRWVYALLNPGRKKKCPVRQNTEQRVHDGRHYRPVLQGNGIQERLLG